MKNTYDKYTLITQSTKKAIEEMKVVLPVDYGKLYRKFSAELDVDLKPDELISYEMVDEKVVRHILSLTQYTEDALEAMHSNNEAKLQDIMNETEKLRIEVQELQKLVYNDTLTKCYNRKWFEDHFLDSHNNCFKRAKYFSMVLEQVHHNHILQLLEN